MSSGASAGVTDSPPPEVVCDAGPLIHLNEVGCLDLLTDFPSALVPTAVREEVERHRPQVFESESIPFVFETPAGAAQPALEALIQTLSLDLGEQAALSLALERPGSIFLTDDSAARLAARALRIRVHGTIGILVRANRRQLRTRGEILDVLRTLPQTSTLHIRRSLLKEVIEEVEGT